MLKVISFLVLLAAIPAFADEPSRRLWARELSTDRPDKTESAYTVEPGYVQVEMDFANFTRSKTKEERVSRWNVAPINIKYGAFDNIDFQLLFDSYLEERVSNLASSSSYRSSGVGDFTFRSKFNLWGNDQGSTALSLMPFIKFPSNTGGFGNTAIEGGLIIPFAAELTDDLSLGAMTEVDILRDGDDQGNHPSFINTITLAYDFNESWGAFIEYFIESKRDGDSPWIGTFDFGATYLLNPDVQLDGGMNLGTTNSAEDIQIFLGLSFRFEPDKLFCDCL